MTTAGLNIVVRAVRPTRFGVGVALGGLLGLAAGIVLADIIVRIY